MARDVGFEPTNSALEADVLPIRTNPSCTSSIVK